ncbi:MAG TPA: exodeoxyribonuclease VII large subunit [Dehalococcoidia bacterium]|nr:exodeoxyribonuclease VII large subunit [Dehalococcoidia bacterium]
MLNDALSVSALCRYLKRLLESDIRLQNVWIEGEITNLSRSGAGHVYFTLKEGNYHLRCIMFQRRVRGMPIDNGAQVLAHGNVGLYEARGDVQIVVDFVQPAGIGARQAEFERLKEKLEAEGLFDPARKRPLPDFPARIGVVTSSSGAALHDITTVLERRWPLTEVVLAPTPVQGPDAVIGLAEAIRALNTEPDIDVIIVARGGGSIDELWAFNEEVVARAIFSSQVPIVSAVGHETDFTIADFVADVRCPTPSAAAETVAPNRADVSREVAGMLASLLLDVRARINDGATTVERAGHRMRASLPNIARYQDNVVSHLRHAQSAVQRTLERRTERVAAFSAQIRSLDPGATLARGYAVVQLRDGKKAITSITQATGKAKLDIHVKDGKFPAEVSRQYGF